MHKSFAIIIDVIRLLVLFSNLLSYTVQISIFISGPTTPKKCSCTPSDFIRFLSEIIPPSEQGLGPSGDAMSSLV